MDRYFPACFDNATEKFQNRGAESILPILSTLASRILNILGETGHDFFISGLDILTVFMDHVPETHPVLLFAGKSDVEEVADILSRNKIDVVPYANIKRPTARKIGNEEAGDQEGFKKNLRDFAEGREITMVGITVCLSIFRLCVLLPGRPRAQVLCPFCRRFF